MFGLTVLLCSPSTAAATTVSVADGVVNVTGDDARDDIRVLVDGAGLLVHDEAGPVTGCAAIDPQTAYCEGTSVRADLLGGDDRYIGEAPAVVAGGVGNDELNGSFTGDALDGEEGDDRLFGGDGPDQLTGGAGRDLIKGDAGDDVLADSGGGKLDAGPGSDVVNPSGDQRFSIRCGEEADLVAGVTFGALVRSDCEEIEHGHTRWLRFSTGSDGTTIRVECRRYVAVRRSRCLGAARRPGGRRNARSRFDLAQGTSASLIAPGATDEVVLRRELVLRF